MDAVERVAAGAVVPGAPAEDGVSRQQWAGLALLVLPILMVSIDVSVVFLALPALSADLGASAVQQLWIVDVYGFVLAGCLVTAGVLGDRIGRRRLLRIGVAGFAVASVLAAFAPTPGALITARVLLGLAGATLAPSSLALIHDLFPHPRRRAAAIGAWFAAFLGGMTIGPLVGAVLLEALWWGAGFLVCVPVMLVVFVGAPRVLPESRRRDAGAAPLDLPSAGLLLLALLPTVFGLKQFTGDGSLAAACGALLVGGLAATLFVRRQRRTAEPLLDLGLLQDRTFGTALCVMLVGSTTLGGVFLLVASHLQLVAGLPPLRAGLWLLVPMTAAAATAVAVTPLLGRLPVGRAVALPLAAAVVGLLVLAVPGAAEDPVAVLVGFTVLNAALAPLVAFTTGLMLESVEPERAGAASGVSETAGELGFALGVALLGSLGAAVHRAAVDADVPAGVLSTDVELLRDGLAGTDSAGLPEHLLELGREAASRSLGVVAATGAVVLTALACAAVVRLRAR